MEIVERISKHGATWQEIELLEQRIKRQLPDDYRQFLVSENGGRPAPTAFEGPEGDGSVIHFFFTLDASSPYYRMHNELDMLHDRIPSDLLPIASDDFGNIILLDLGAKSVGAIYFWDHENENMDGDPWWDNISYIAPSFSTFVENLH